VNDWGREWGRYRLPDGRVVSMQRKTIRVRFFDTVTGEQVGDEHRNVVPAMAFAAYHGWWDMAASADLNVRTILEVRANTRT